MNDFISVQNTSTSHTHNNTHFKLKLTNLKRNYLHNLYYHVQLISKN